MGPFQQLVESQPDSTAVPTAPAQPGPFEKQVEARENIVVQRTGKDAYVTHGWDAAGRPIEQFSRTPADAAAAKRAAEVGMG